MRKPITDRQKSIIHKELRRHGNKSRAVKAAKTSRMTFYRLMENDPVFAAAAKAAIKEGTK